MEGRKKKLKVLYIVSLYQYKKARNKSLKYIAVKSKHYREVIYGPLFSKHKEGS